MKLRTWKYFINQGISGIFKNGLMSFASTAIVSACIFIVILSLCIITNVNYIMQQIESEIGITLYLGEKPTQANVDSLITTLKNMPEVSEVTFISADEALEDAKDIYNTEFLDGLKDDNPLPRSIELKLKDIKLQKLFIKKLEQLQWEFEEQILGIKKADTPATDSANEQVIPQSQTTTAVQTSSLFTETVYANELTLGDKDYEFQGIELISHAQQLTDTLVTIDAAFKIISITLIAILSIISIGIIMNTIKLTVFVRKNEINIMKYVGATDWFIRWRFIIEGIVIGLVGAILPSIICTLGYIKIYSLFENEYILKNIAHLKPAMDIFTVIIPISLLIGMLIGAIWSISSIRKHLKV